jgi:hypothetical protein
MFRFHVCFRSRDNDVMKIRAIKDMTQITRRLSAFPISASRRAAVLVVSGQPPAIFSDRAE